MTGDAKRVFLQTQQYLCSSCSYETAEVSQEGYKILASLHLSVSDNVVSTLDITVVEIAMSLVRVYVKSTTWSPRRLYVDTSNQSRLIDLSSKSNLSCLEAFLEKIALRTKLSLRHHA